MSENTYLTYNKKNQDVIINKLNIIIKMIKRNSENRQEINTETCLKKKKIKKENMGKIGTVIYLKKRNNN